MEAKYTPDKWRVGITPGTVMADSVKLFDDKESVTIATNVNPVDAKLIALAPDMYELLKTIAEIKPSLRFYINLLFKRLETTDDP